MSHRSPSRTRSHTPTCPDDPEEKDERRRAISRIQQDVERELENADRVLSTIDTFTGSRIPSRAGSQQRGSAGRQEDLGIAGQGRRSVSGFSDERPRKNSKEACPRSTAHSVAETGGVDSRGQGPSAARDEYDTGADGVDYDTHGGVYGGPGSPYGGAGGVGSGHGGAGGPGSPYGGAGGVGSGHGGAGGPGDPYGGMGGVGSGHGAAYGGPGSPYGGTGGIGSGHGGASGPDDPYGGMGGAGSGHGGAGGPGDPYGGMGGMGSGHGGAGGPGSPYGGAGGIGSGHGGAGGPGSPYGGAGGPGSPYGGAGGIGSGHGGAGGPGSPYGGAGGPGSPYGGAGGIGSGHGGAGGPGSPYGGAGGPGDPYDGAGGGYAGPGDSYGAQGGYLENEDPYAMSKSSGGPASAARSRDQSKMAYDQERTASGMPYESGSSAGYGSRGKSPPSVHYSPSTALSARGESPSKFQGSGHPSGSGFNGNRSPTETQYSASRVQSRPGYDASRDPSGYERGGSQTVPKGQSGLIGADSGYGEGTDARGYEGAGSRTFTAGGSRGSPGRSVKGPSPNASRGTGVLGAVDQSLINNNVCPAAVQGKCPAFARDSSAFARNRSAAGSGTSASKRTLGRIEEGLPSEEMAADGAHGQEEDFRPLSGGMHSPVQVGGGGGYTPCPPPLPRRTHYSGVPEQPVYQSPASRSPAMGLAQPSIPSRPTVQYENQHHHHHDHDHDHDHDGEGFLGKPVPERDENATLALNRLSQIKQTPSYLKCKPDRGIDLSSCDQSTKGAPKVVKFPEKPCKGIEELQDLIDCETRDVESAWYLTSDEKKTYKKPCPKQQKAQENVKSIIKAQTPQSCSKEYSPLEHPDPDDITPELAASMMFSQEQGIKLNECPDEAIKRLFPDIPRPPFPVKLSSVHIVDSNKEDQEEIIEKSASVPSEGVSDSAYTRTMQNKGEGMGVQKSYDIDFAVGAEKREYVLVAEKPRRYNKVQFRGNLPSWFPGYMEAFPQSQPGIKLVESPSRVFQKAWTSTNPEKLPSSDIIVLD